MSGWGCAVNRMSGLKAPSFYKCHPFFLIFAPAENHRFGVQTDNIPTDIEFILEFINFRIEQVFTTYHTVSDFAVGFCRLLNRKKHHCKQVFP